MKDATDLAETAVAAMVAAVADVTTAVDLAGTAACGQSCFCAAVAVLVTAVATAAATTAACGLFFFCVAAAVLVTVAAMAADVAMVVAVAVKQLLSHA